MTAVEFHTGIAQPTDYVCRLLRKAYRRGVQVMVTAPEATLAVLDAALWSFEAGEFLPHIRQPGANPALAEQTSIWLSTTASLPVAPRIVLNLGVEALTDLANIDRLIEIVSTEDSDVTAGRLRWRQYQALGLEPKRQLSNAAQGDA